MNTRNSIGRGLLLALVVALVSACAENPEALVKSAKENLAKGDQAAAVIQLRGALQKKPDLAEARFLLGSALLDTGEIPASERELRKAIEFDYPADQVVPTLVRAMVAQGQYKKAIEEFGSSTISSPQANADLQSALGQAYLATGNVAAARVAFETALAAKPDHPSAMVGQARLTASSGDLPGALVWVERAVAKAPTLSEGWRIKGDLLGIQGKTDEALVAYRKAVETDPRNLEAHYMVVSLLIQQDKMEEAGERLGAMGKVAPRQPQTLYLQALLAFRQQKFTVARDAIQQQLKLAPDNTPGLLLSARIGYELQAYAQVESELRKVLKQIPNDGTARRLLVQTYMRSGQPRKALETMAPILEEKDLDPNTLALIAGVYAANRDMAKSVTYLEKSAALDPGNAGKKTSLALARMGTKDDGGRGLRELEEVADSDTGIRADLALIVMNIGQRKYDAALAGVAALEKKRPDDPLAYSLRGKVLLAKGDTAAARKSFEQAIAKDPAFFPAVSDLARLDLAENKPDDAAKRFDAVLAKNPKSVPALLALAGTRAAAGGSSEEVAKLIGNAAAADPNDPKPRLALITHYIRTNQPKLAVAAAQEALAAMPDRPEILEVAGRAYLAAGITNQAITTYLRLAQLRPDSPLPFMRLAEVHLAAGDRVAALDNVRKALAIKPDFSDAQFFAIALYLSSGKTPAALAMARDMQKQRPKEAAGYLFEGDILARQEAWADAAAVYRKGLTNVGTTELAIRLDIALTRGGNAAEAGKFEASWIRDHPNDFGFRHHLGEAAIARKDYAGAARQYKTILEGQPNDARALNNLAWVSGEIKDPKAVEYAEKANAIAPNDPRNMDTLGMLLVDKGETKRGIELLQRAVGLAPDVGIIRLNLARALVKDGQKDVAKKELDELAKLGDKFSGQAEVAKLLQGL